MHHGFNCWQRKGSRSTNEDIKNSITSVRRSWSTGRPDGKKERRKRLGEDEGGKRGWSEQKMRTAE